MSGRSIERGFGAIVLERIASRLTPSWFLKTFGVYTGAAAVSALLFLVVAGTMAFPLAAWSVFFVVLLFILAAVFAGATNFDSEGATRTMYPISAFFMAFELPLLVARKLFPATASFLPLGGDEFNQAAILLMIALFVNLFAAVATSLTRGVRKGRN